MGGETTPGAAYVNEKSRSQVLGWTSPFSAAEELLRYFRLMKVRTKRRVVPPATLADSLRRLEEQGLVTVGTGRWKRFAAIRLAKGVQLSTAVLADRG